LTEAATVVGRTLIVALRESGATLNALIVIGFAYRWIAASSQFYWSILVRDRYCVSILAGLDTLTGIHGRHGHSHAQEKHPNRAYELEALQFHVGLLNFHFATNAPKGFALGHQKF
jgi:hypothetical protein